MNNLKTGYIVFYSGTSFISRSIKFFMYIFNFLYIRKKIKIPSEDLFSWVPSHIGTIFIEENKVFIGESVWLRYRLNDFYEEYKKGNYKIFKLKDDFTNEEIEQGKQYMIKLSSLGTYQWWKYPAWIFYSITNKKWLFSKKSSDYNTICYESAARVLEKMRPGFFPKDYDFETAYYGDILFDNRLEVVVDNKN